MKKIDFKSKGFTIIISLFFAVLFWAFVMADSNTTRVADIRNIQVTFRGAEALTQKGLVVTGKSKETISARIEGSVNVVGYINSNNIFAYVDMNNISQPGEYELHVNTYSNNGGVVVRAASPDKIKVTVEQFVEKEVPVEIVYDKDVSDNYWVNSATTQDDRVKVSGGFSSVQKTARAVVRVNADRLIQMYEENPLYTYESSIPLEMVDENNNLVEGIEGSSTIVTIDLMTRKNVPVDVRGAIVGKPQAGFSLGVIEQSVNSIDIVGKRDIVNGISNLSVEEINVGGIRANQVKDVTIKAVDGIALIGGNIVKVNINVVSDVGN